MSELVAMRQRIKAIETIKKVTHAMRLISMSIHSHMRERKENLLYYKNNLNTLIALLLKREPCLLNNIPDPLKKKSYFNNMLLILIGSQKGLCGNFNTNLSLFLDKKKKSILSKNIRTILVGKKITEISSLRNETITIEFSEFTQNNILNIAQKIADHIWHTQIPYSSVILFYNIPKTFFVQKPEQVDIIKFCQEIYTKNDLDLAPKETYFWEQDSKIILDQLFHKFVQAIIQNALIDSLIAEQAARFVAMDNSTRNASNLLEEMQLQYNKTRQARITRELTDLVASFQ